MLNETCIESTGMKLTSLLPLGSIFFKHWHTDDSEIGVGVAKAGFHIQPNGTMKTIRPAPELAVEDIFEGDPAMTALVSEQDIAPSKTATDIVIRANAHSPGGKALPDWPVAVSIPDKLNYGFQVRGPAMWENGLLGWKMSDPEPVTMVPLTYALAYGGPAMGDPEAGVEDVYQFNPAGRGFTTDETLKGKTAFPAPQIGELGEFISGVAGKEMMVHGVGPIAKPWLPRRAFAGTFDQEWQDTRHPRMPHDYDLGFWNIAHPRLQIKDFLQGDETITLHGMTPGGGDRSIALPGIKMMLNATGDNIAKNHTMKLDTVLIDILDDDPANHTLHLIWRARVTGPDRFSDGQLQSVKLG